MLNYNNGSVYSPFVFTWNKMWTHFFFCLGHFRVDTKKKNDESYMWIKYRPREKKNNNKKLHGTLIRFFLCFLRWSVTFIFLRIPHRAVFSFFLFSRKFSYLVRYDCLKMTIGDIFSTFVAKKARLVNTKYF